MSTIPDFPITWNYGRRRNLNSEKYTPRPTMVMMNCARKGKEYWFGNSMKLCIGDPKMDKFSPLNVKLDDEASEFDEELVACEARLNQEYWAASWLRAECYWEDLENERINAENFKWLFAEKEFVALKRRCDEQLGSKKCKCILMVKKEDGSSLVNRVVGTLDLRIQYFSPGVKTPFPEERQVVGEGVMDRRECSYWYGYISNVCVAKSARRQGVATTMLQHAISIAHHHSLERLFLHVNGDNEAALRLYEKMGFKVVEGAKYELRSGEALLLLCFEASS